MPAAVEWLNEFQVNTGTAATGGQSDPKIVGLSNGNYLLAWVEDPTGTVAGVGDDDIIGKIFDPEGRVVRDAFRLSAPSGAERNFQQEFDIAATNDGGFVIVYVSNYTTTNGGDNVSAIDWHRHNSSGNETNFLRISSETDDGEFYSEPQIIFNQQSGTSVITGFHYNIGFLDVDVDRYAWTVRADGLVTGIGDAADNQADEMVETDGGTALLTNGNFVSVYQEDDNDSRGIEVRIGTTSGGQVRLFSIFGEDAGGTFPILGYQPQVASLAGGGFAVTWWATRGSGDVQFQVFDNSGNRVSDVRIAVGSTDSLAAPTVVALTDGDFVIAWRNVTDGTLEARRFNPNGTLLAGEEEVFVVATGVRADPEAGITGDGRILFTWQGTNNEIFSSIWDPRARSIAASAFERNLPNFVNSDVFTAGPRGSEVFGDNADNVLLGQGGDDLLEGGQGTDTVRGGGGRDTIRIRNLDQIDHVDGGDGVDTLTMAGVTSAGSGARIYMRDFVFNGLGVGTTIRNIENVIGTQLGDTILAADGANVLAGLGGVDNLEGGRGVDSIFGGADGDRITIGNGEEIDHVHGEGGYDYLLLGGIRSAGQQVAIDLLAATFDGFGGRTAISGIEEIFATQLADVIRGDDLANVLHGEGGADTLVGRDGSDVLDGGTGADRMEGGGGNDTFIVDNAGDRVIEGTSQGTADAVAASVSFSLAGQHIENLTLTGANAIAGTGNGFANRLIGNGAANRLDGAGGADRMEGNGGNDTYVVDNAGDVAVETPNQGTDLVESSVTFSLAGQHIERLTLTGAGNLQGTGNDLANVIRGNTGSNKLTGNGGSDDLHAGADNVRDLFIYAAPGDSGLSAATSDEIFQFDRSAAAGDTTNDRIDLSLLDADPDAGNQAFRFVTAFATAAPGRADGQVRVDVNGANSRVVIDINGDNSADMIIGVIGVSGLSDRDFIL